MKIGLSIETSQFTIEQVKRAVKHIQGYVDTLKRLGKEIPLHTKMAIFFLSQIEELPDFKPKRG